MESSNNQESNETRLRYLPLGIGIGVAIGLALSRRYRLATNTHDFFLIKIFADKKQISKQNRKSL
jgi:hypothetical protein